MTAQIPEEVKDNNRKHAHLGKQVLERDRVVLQQETADRAYDGVALADDAVVEVPHPHQQLRRAHALPLQAAIANPGRCLRQEWRDKL